MSNYSLKLADLSCYQVRRLYDTFHEPFKRVVPSYPADPETSTQKNDEPGSTNEDKEAKDTEHERKRKKKETEVTVKSALSAAFAKYSDKLGREKNNSQGVGGGETSSAAEVEAEKENL